MGFRWIAPLGLLWLTAVVWAQPDTKGESPIRTGEFRGLWARHPAVFSIELVHDNGTFDGVAVHADGPFKGIKFGFHGKIEKDQSITITRHVAGEKQTARAAAPRLDKGNLVWSAETTGFGVPKEGSWPFVLVIPKKESK
jgi:hypothetical protein